MGNYSVFQAEVEVWFWASWHCFDALILILLLEGCNAFLHRAIVCVRTNRVVNSITAFLLLTITSSTPPVTMIIYLLHVFFTILDH